MENRNDERVIYLTDLIFSVLYRWKVILVCVLAFALLLGGYKCVASPTSAADPAAITKYETQRDYLTQRIATIQTNIEGQQAYIDNSLLMKLDPYHYYQLTIRCYVNTGYQIQPGSVYQTPDLAPSLIAAYQAMVSGQDGLQAVGDALELEAAYVAGALTATTTEDTNVFTIQFTCATEEQAKIALSVLENQLDLTAAKLTGTMGAHQLQLLESAISCTASKELATTQNSMIQQLKTLQTELKDTQTQLSGLAAPGGATKTTVLKSAVKFAVLGAGFGLIASAGLLCLAHIVSNNASRE